MDPSFDLCLMSLISGEVPSKGKHLNPASGSQFIWTLKLCEVLLKKYQYPSPTSEQPNKDLSWMYLVFNIFYTNDSNEKRRLSTTHLYFINQNHKEIRKIAPIVIRSLPPPLVFTGVMFSSVNEMRHHFFL